MKNILFGLIAAVAVVVALCHIRQTRGTHSYERNL